MIILRTVNYFPVGSLAVITDIGASLSEYNEFILNKNIINTDFFNCKITSE